MNGRWGVEEGVVQLGHQVTQVTVVTALWKSYHLLVISTWGPTKQSYLST